MRYCVLLIAILSQVPAAGQAVTVRVAGRPAMTDPPPREIAGQLLLPAPFLTDCLGLHLEKTAEPTAWRLGAYGRYLKVRRDSTRCTIDTTAVEASSPSRLIDGRLYVPAEMITRAFGVQWARGADGTSYDLTPPGAEVQEVREGSYPERLRLVFDLTGPAPYWTIPAPGELAIEIPPPTPRPPGWGCLRLFTFSDAMRPRVTARVTDGDWVRLLISYEGSQPATVLSLGDPPRLVVDIPRERGAVPATVPPVPRPTPPPPEELGPPTPAAATPWVVRNFSTARGPVRVFVLKATPTAVRPALAAATIRRRARVSVIAAREGAQAAVNGGYFDWSGPPLGMLVIGGEWIKAPIRNRCVLGITDRGQPLMERLRFDGGVTIEGVGKFELSGLNTGHWQPDTLILYTRRWDSEVAGAPATVRLVVNREAKVAQVETGGASVAIPGDGYVLSAGGTGAAALSRVPVGATVAVTLDTVPHWPEVRYALGAGPQLVKNGQLAVTTDEEQVRSDVRRISARAAVGIAEDGNIIVMGAEAAVARGLDLTETAGVMLKLGCRDAMALDGGGSTTVVSGRHVLNQPSDGSERPVSNALLVFGQPATQ